MSRVFYKSVGRGASQLSYDPSSKRIYFSTLMYDPKQLMNRMVEVDICEEDWIAIVKYGEDAGFSQ